MDPDRDRGHKQARIRARRGRKKVADLAIKGPEKVDFGLSFLVFSTRLLQNFADSKRVKNTLHQMECTFFALQGEGAWGSQGAILVWPSICVVGIMV